MLRQKNYHGMAVAVRQPGQGMRSSCCFETCAAWQEMCQLQHSYLLPRQRSFRFDLFPRQHPVFERMMHRERLQRSTRELPEEHHQVTCESARNWRQRHRKPMSSSIALRLEPKQFGIQTIPCQQFGMSALVNDGTVFKNNDAVR